MITEKEFDDLTDARRLVRDANPVLDALKKMPDGVAKNAADAGLKDLADAYVSALSLIEEHIVPF